MLRWINFNLNKGYRWMSKMVDPYKPLKDLVRVCNEVCPSPKPTIGYTWIPRFINPPAIEMTKALIIGVDCDEVYPNIFIGDEGSAKKKEFLKAVGINHVLNAAEGTSFGHVNTNAEFYNSHDINYKGFKLMDTPTARIINHFEEASSFIDSALNSGGKVLVHCLMGMSRSATFVAAYLMKKKEMTAKDALTMLRKQREIRPNDGFLIQLLDLERQQFNK